MRNHNRSYGRYPYRPQKRARHIGGMHIKPCPGVAEYIGNVFLLGLTTLAGEVIDLQAANALDVLLSPFQNQQTGGDAQEILAGDLEDTDIIDLLDGLI